MRRMLRVMALSTALSSLACHRERLSANDCRALLGRITDLELAERGFRDPALAARRKAALQTRLAPELATCVGRRVRPGALACAQSARSAEDLSHRCLR
jgi:hypothetical protein